MKYIHIVLMVACLAIGFLSGYIVAKNEQEAQARKTLEEIAVGIQEGSRGYRLVD